VSVGASVSVGNGVADSVAVGVSDGVALGSGVAVSVAVNVIVAVAEADTVGVGVGEFVGVGDKNGVSVAVEVSVGVSDDNSVGVCVGVSVGLAEGSTAIAVGLGVVDDARVGAIVGVIGIPGCKLQASTAIVRLIVTAASAKGFRPILGSLLLIRYLPTPLFEVYQSARSDDRRHPTAQPTASRQVNRLSVPAITCYPQFHSICQLLEASSWIRFMSLFGVNIATRRKIRR
jgi:hypothetical protein